MENENSKFHVGLVVRLKSGSPDMTVSEMMSDTCRCVWFIEEGVENWRGPYRETFVYSGLVVVETS